MNKRILIVGLGLIGGSYAMGLSKKGFEVYAISRQQKSIDYAIEHGLIKDGRITSDPEFIGSFDRIVLALYPKVLLKWVEENGAYLKEGTIVTDVTGIKCEIVGKIQNSLPSGVEFIAAHPMAGREVYGVENASSEIFKNANYIIVPTERNTEEGINFARFFKLSDAFRLEESSIFLPFT
mgnify:CR=1 FL=1